MKKTLLLITAILLALSLAACTAAPDAGQSSLPSPSTSASPTTATPAPRKTASPSPAQSVSPLPMASPSPTANEAEPPEGYIPGNISAGGYTPDSCSDLYEDENYIVFRDRSGILVFDKSVDETLTVLPRCVSPNEASRHKRAAQLRFPAFLLILRP
jgi:hypothetical protein